MPLALLQKLARGFGRVGGGVEPQPWRAPTLLDRGPLGEARLALDRRGRGLALWENHAGIWSMPVGPGHSRALARLPVGEGMAPRIAMNEEGRGIVIWVADLGQERQILGRALGSGETAGHAVFTTTGQIHHLQVAVDRRGNALVVWLHLEGDRHEVLAQSFDLREAGWEKAPTPLGQSQDAAASPRLAANHKEHAMVLWASRDAWFEGLVASHHWPSDKAWSDHPVPVVAHPVRHPQVVMDDAGNALALWVHAPYGQKNLLEASYFDVHRSEWGEPVVLAQAQTLAHPRLVMNGEGEALALWNQGENAGSVRLMAKVFRGISWEQGQECLELAHEPIRDFAAAIGADGRAGVVVVQHRPEGDRVLARLREGEWAPPVVVGGGAGLRCQAPRMALCPGGASALWQQGAGRDRMLMLVDSR